MAEGKIRCLTEKWQELDNSFISHRALEDHFNVEIAVTTEGHQTILDVKCPGDEYLDLMKIVGGPWEFKPAIE